MPWTHKLMKETSPIAQHLASYARLVFTKAAEGIAAKTEDSVTASARYLRTLHSLARARRFSKSSDLRRRMDSGCDAASPSSTSKASKLAEAGLQGGICVVRPTKQLQVQGSNLLCAPSHCHRT